MLDFSRTTDELSDSANYELNNINIILQEEIMKYAKKKEIYTKYGTSSLL